MMIRILYIFILVLATIPAFASETDSISVEPPDSLGMARSLGEVEVTARNQYAINGGTAYVPAKIAKRTSNDAYVLLQRIGISDICVNDKRDIINSLQEKAVTFINGSEATQDEVRALIPTDIKRIEVLRFPEDPRFRGLPFVVNFITQKFAYGGYVVAEGFQQFFNEGGIYKLFGKFVNGKSTFQLRGETGYSNPQDYSGESTEHYDLENYPDHNPVIIDRITQWTRRGGETLSPGAAFSWKYQGDETWSLTTRANFSYYHQSNLFTDGLILSGNTPTEYSQYYRCRYIIPNLSVVFEKVFSNRSSIYAQAALNVSANNARSGYSQDGFGELHNRSSETVYRPSFYLYYSYPLPRSSSISMALYVEETIYKVNYTGTANTDSRVSEGLYQLSPSYQKIFNFGDNNLVFTNTLRIPLRRLTTADGSEALTCNPYDRLHLGLSLGNVHSLAIGGLVTRIGRPASTINDVPIRDTDITGHRGNGNMKEAWRYYLYATYTWLPKNWVNLTGTVDYSHEMNALTMDFKAIDNVIYSQWVNSGVLSRLNISANASFRLLRNSLILTPGVSVNHTHTSGIFPVDFWRLTADLSATYMMKNGLSFSANFSTPATKWYDNSNPSLRKWDYYTFSVNAGYTVGNLNASVNIRPFYKTVTMKDYTAITGVEINKISHIPVHGREISVTLRYTLDFGRKTAKGDEVTVDATRISIQ